MSGWTLPPDVALRRTAGVQLDFPDERLVPAEAVAMASAGDAREPLTAHELVLWQALGSAGPLPALLWARLPRVTELLAGLVVRGLVEVADGAGGFGAGARALARFRTDAGVRHAISTSGLHYAIAQRGLRTAELARRLYSFNSLPAGSLQADRGTRGGDLFRTLTGIDLEQPVVHLAGRQWHLEQTYGWMFFRTGSSGRARPFKIYLSPRPAFVRDVIETFAHAVGDADGAIFKIAHPVGSLIRPDKIVAYVTSYDQLERTLARLRDSLPPVPAQPVPFSAAVGTAGLLSWGVDPTRVISKTTPSWRAWITKQIATCVARLGDDDDVEDLRAALAAHDIDPDTWLPRQELVTQRWSVNL